MRKRRGAGAALWAALTLSTLIAPGCRRYHQPPGLPGAGPIQSVPAAAGEVNLLLLGDWGSPPGGTSNDPNPAERAVAAAIEEYAGEVHFDAGLLLGDNFYTALSGVNDPKWRTLFEDVYRPASLPFFASLGNHDYSTANAAGVTNTEVEFEYARQNPQGRFRMPGRWYRIDIPEEAPRVSVLVLDSNHAYMSEADWRKQKSWLRSQLEGIRSADRGAGAGDRWVVCCAHHPIYTNGNHEHDGRIRRDWLPLFKRHRAHFYACGHNHCLEHLEGRDIPGPRADVSFVVSGAGGRGLYGFERRHKYRFFRRTHGFAHLRLGPEEGELRLIDTRGVVLHSFVRPRTRKSPDS